MGTFAIPDRRTLQPTPESGGRAGFDGAEKKNGFVLLPRRWVVERSFGWLGRFQRLARDDERLTETVARWHWLACLTLRLPRLGLDRA